MYSKGQKSLTFQENIIFWLKMPALVTANTSGNVPKVWLKIPGNINFE